MATSKGHSWSDQPVTNAEDDRLGRHAFAVRLAESISQLATPDCVVIGLFGPWGSGKTTVLKFVENELASHDNLVVVWFNPWMVGGSEEALVRDFVLSVAEAIDSNLETGSERLAAKAARIGRWAKVASTVPVVGGIASAIAVASEETLESTGKSLHEFRTLLNERLEESGKKVLVIVDDLDRLARSQVATMFRVIKAIGEFKHTRYLLAFDRAVVARLLDVEFDGLAFIEKIVQVPLELPAPRLEQINDQFAGLLGDALTQHGIQWSSELDDQLAGLFPFLERHGRTPRSIKQLAYVVDFLLPLVTDEVNAADLIMMEALRLFEPQVHRFVFDNRADFLAVTSHRSMRGRTSVTESMESTIRALSGLVDDELDRLATVLALLRWLFPLLEASMPKSIPRLAGSSGSDETGRRVCSPEFFDNYFRYGPGNIAETEVEALVGHAIAGRASDFRLRLAHLAEVEPLLLVTKLERRIEAAELPDRNKLVSALAERAAAFFRPDEELADTRTPFSRLATTIARTAYVLESPSLLDLIKCGDLHMIAKIFQEIRRAGHDPDVLVTEWKAFGERLAARPGAPLFKDEGSFAAPFMTALVRLDGNTRDQITVAIEVSPQSSTTALRSWCHRVQAMAGSHRWGDHHFMAYDDVAEVLDPNVLAKALHDTTAPNERPTFVDQFLAEHESRSKPTAS